MPHCLLNALKFGESTMPSRKSSALSVTLAVCAALAIPFALAAEFPAGTYQSADVPFTVTFDANGKFRVNQDNKLQVAGDYSAKAGQLTITDSQGPWACTKAGEQTGTYKWAYASGTLTLSKVADECVDRVKSIDNRSWKRAAGPG
jgi:hypothetical protein